MRDRRILALAVAGLALLALLVWLTLFGGGGEPETAPDDPVPERVDPPRVRPPRHQRNPREVDGTKDEEPEPAAGTETPTEGPPAVEEVKPPANVTVRVLDETGAPVPEAWVVAVDRYTGLTGDKGFRAFVAERTAAATGIAKFHFERGTSAPAPTSLLFLAAKGGQGGISRAVDLRAGEDLEVEVRVALGLDIHGVVVGEGDRPLESAHIRLTFGTRDVVRLHLDVRTDEQGAFVFPTLPLNPYRPEVLLTANAPGHFEASRMVGPQDHDARLEIRLRPGIAVTGRCIDAAGDPVAAVDVVLIGQAAQPKTDAEGRFVAGTMPLTGGDLLLIPPHHAPVHLNIPGDHAGVVGLGDVVLREGGPIDGIIVGADGTPRANVRVQLVDGVFSRALRTRYSGEDGTFVINNAPDDECVLVADFQGLSGKRLEARRTGVRANDRGVRLVLAEGLTVLVKFLAASDRSPVKVPDVKLRARPVGGAGTEVAWGYVGSDLTSVHAKFEDAGVYDIEVEVPGYELGVAQSITVDPQRAVEIDVLFTKLPE